MSIYNCITNNIRKKDCSLTNTKDPLVIKKRRGEDGNRLITLRIHEELLAEIDKIAAEANYSRNELINKILEHGVKNLIIEK